MCWGGCADNAADNRSQSKEKGTFSVSNPRQVSLASGPYGGTHLPAANRVPLADPNVDTVTDRGISQAITPRIRFPKVCEQDRLFCLSLP